EVVFVDDGSTDNSFAILNKVIRENPNIEIQVFQQKNQGAAAARYLAAKKSKYDYVIYHDCDDIISENAILELLAPFNNKSIDAALFDLKVESISKNGQIKINNTYYFSENKYLTGKDCFINSLNGWKIHNLICTKKSIFLEANKIYRSYNKSLENYISNDEIIGRIIWNLCGKVVRTNAIYYYKYNSKSTTKGINQDFYKILKNERMIVNIAHENNIEDISIYIHQVYMLRFLIKRYIKDKKDIYKKKFWLDEMIIHLLWCRKLFTKLPIKWKRRYIKIFLQLQWLRLFS
uniref:glycosyltransferase family 2 protein n=1 Tax=Clostridium sp. TaxID=1506 RepID=UPI002631E2CA